MILRDGMQRQWLAICLPASHIRSGLWHPSRDGNGSSAGMRRNARRKAEEPMVPGAKTGQGLRGRNPAQSVGPVCPIEWKV
jgi:hypothetical protein